MTRAGRWAGVAAWVALAFVVPAAAVGQSPAPPITLKGAGATFPAPLYYKWTELYSRERPNVRISYDSVGSGDGVARFVAGMVDFGASDAGMRDEAARTVERGTLQIPGTAGMIGLVYNLPGFKGPLRLPREVYVDILRGAIKSWDDPRIKAANPELTFPRRDIALVARLDRSGTTFALTGHLSAISETWRKGPGAGTAIEWPRHAMLARGNEGVASRVKISEGSLGYVEFGFASRLGLAMAELENKSGKFVKPGLASGQSALAESVSALGNPMRTDITDPAQPDSYPITTFTWLLLYRSYPDENRRNAVKEFVTWGLTAGQAHAQPLGYIALPESVVAWSRLAVGTIR